MEIRRDVLLRDYTTFRIGGTASVLVRITHANELPDLVAYARKEAKEITLLGEGSNTVFTEEKHDGIVARIEILGFAVVAEDATSAEIEVGAGENWDSVVERAVAMNLSGIEALSAIPGTTGATPFQNVGAYGTEIKDVLVSLRAYDMKTDVFVTLPNTVCGFSYRDSIFKSSERGRYIIVSTRLRLSKSAPKAPDYPGVEAYFEKEGIALPSLADIRKAIIAIRATKLPDPKSVPNAGSFFKNPIVSNTQAEVLRAAHPNMVQFPVGPSTGSRQAKLGAGWLIESCGLKGAVFGPITVYEKNALVLTNTGNASAGDLIAARDEIVQKVFEKFGVTLEAEPIFVY